MTITIITDKRPEVGDDIEEAEFYMIVPAGDRKGMRQPIPIGNKIAMRAILEYMTRDNIIFTMGSKKKRCIIYVDYTRIQVLGFAERASKKLERFKTEDENRHE